jgi:hypothetical protein
MCIAYLNQLFQFYIGLNLVELIDKSIMSKNIEDILNILVSKSVINRYDYTLEPNFRNGTLTVNLSLLTNYMTESLKISSIINVNSE